MKVASYNIHKCRGSDGMTRPDRIVGVIRELGADVVALQEVDRRFGRRGGLLDPAAIRHETGMNSWCSRTFPTVTAGTATHCSCAAIRSPTHVRA